MLFWSLAETTNRAVCVYSDCFSLAKNERRQVEEDQIRRGLDLYRGLDSQPSRDQVPEISRSCLCCDRDVTCKYCWLFCWSAVGIKVF